MKIKLENGEIVHVSFDFPPIPLRNFDWSCVSENYDVAPDSTNNIIGYGTTKQEAIDDYLSKQRVYY